MLDEETPTLVRGRVDIGYEAGVFYLGLALNPMYVEFRRGVSEEYIRVLRMSSGVHNKK